jgi:undecaprenyl pyrophosphate phosphatase UppP
MNKQNPIVIYKRVDSITIYEVTEDELETLSKGNIGSLYLNISLALLPTSISLFTVLLLTKIDSDRMFSGFLIFALLFGLIGIIFLAIWFFKRKEQQKTINKIKERTAIQVQATQIQTEE